MLPVRKYNRYFFYKVETFQRPPSRLICNFRFLLQTKKPSTFIELSYHYSVTKLFSELVAVAPSTKHHLHRLQFHTVHSGHSSAAWRKRECFVKHLQCAELGVQSVRGLMAIASVILQQIIKQNLNMKKRSFRLNQHCWRADLRLRFVF